MIKHELSDMAGPTDKAREIQLVQANAADEIYAVMRAVREARPGISSEEMRAVPEVIAANAVYDATVEQLEALLGKDASCCYIDCELWSSFSDFFKSENNIRPRFHITREGVLQYFARGTSK